MIISLGRVNVIPLYSTYLGHGGIFLYILTSPLLSPDLENWDTFVRGPQTLLQGVGN